MVVYRQLHGMGLPEAPPNLSLLRHSPDSRDTTFRGASFLICAEKKYHNLKRSPPTFLGPPSFRGDPPAVSRVACMPSTTPTHTPECLAPYSLGVVGAQSCLGKLLFCLETPLPTSLYPLWSGTERCCGEVSQVPKLPFPQVPPLLNRSFPAPSPARCLSYLPQYFHLVSPPQCQLIWGLRLVVKQDPVGLGLGD